MREAPASAARRVRAAAVAALLCGASAASALAAFPSDAPDDPAYNPAEQGGPETCLERAGDQQQAYLFSFIPRCTPGATDSEGSAGMFIDEAWRLYTTGDSGTLIAYIEGGINWQDDPEELADKVFLNRGELPAPTTPAAPKATLNARDYADTKDVNANELVDPEDILVRFSDGVDDDRNGYTDDISGWDFYNDQNDPATLDSEYDHANGQMKQAASETNNGIGEAGICPRCMLLPIKAGAEALDRTDDLAQAWLYAADMDADVLVSVTADLGYSSFMADVVEYVWRKGTVMVEASNDFNSLDHQGGMFWPHVLPGNGLVANTHGLSRIPGSAPLANAATVTYRARSAYTSWGAHNMFSVATTGGTTSEATPTLGGVMALVLSYGKKAARKGLIDRPLTPSEAIQVVRATSSDVFENPNPPLGWPAKPGWDLQFGYGRPNVLAAMEAIESGDVPPEAWISSPDWYSLFDPTRRDSVRVRGHVAAPRSPSYKWRLEFAPGPEPSEEQFILAASGAGTEPRDGLLGEIDFGEISKTFWRRAFELSDSKTLETNDQFTVTLRLRVRDAKGRLGEERRAIALHHDPSLRRGFPVRFGPGGESQPAIANLRGGTRQALIFGDADGFVHALAPNGGELPGFPVHTRPTVPERRHRGVDPGFEPVLSNVAVGDLGGSGRQSIVVTSTTGRVYVWGPGGKLRPGWPKKLARGVRKPAIPRPQHPFSRPAIMGATAPPVLVDLDGDRGLEIVQSGWDGHIHAWNANGRRVRGWPVRVTLPASATPPEGMITIEDEKLDLSPTLGELDGDPGVELIQRTQYAFATGAGLKFPFEAVSNVVAYNHDGSRVDGFLLSGDALAFYYGSAQEFITEGTHNPSTADIDGDGLSEIASAAGIFSPTTLYNADGTERMILAPLPGALISLVQGDPAALLDAYEGDLPEDTPVNFTTSGAFGRFGPGGSLAYAEPGTGGATVAASLLFPGSGLPINNYIRAFDAATGLPMPGMPAKMQGLDFLGGPAIADVTGDGETELLVGGDSSALHAYVAGGDQAAAFPKFHTGWVVFGPSVGDLDGNGEVEVAVATREGYLMVWDTAGRAEGNDEWWSYRHDERNTGSYGIDTRPPGPARRVLLRRNSRKLTFEAPGDDFMAGRVDHYVVSGERLGSNGGPFRERFDADALAGATETLRLPPRVGHAVVYAVDEAGNRGPVAGPR